DGQAISSDHLTPAWTKHRTFTDSSNGLDWPNWTVNGHSVASVFALFSDESLGRFGLWMSDLSITQLMQEQVPEENRGAVFGVQGALCLLLSVVAQLASRLRALLPGSVCSANRQLVFVRFGDVSHRVSQIYPGPICDFIENSQAIYALYVALHVFFYCLYGLPVLIDEGVCVADHSALQEIGGIYSKRVLGKCGDVKTYIARDV
ncbi:solute carrier family 40member 1, partial [Aphelenchoides avenae]